MKKWLAIGEDYYSIGEDYYWREIFEPWRIYEIFIEEETETYFRYEGYLSPKKSNDVFSFHQLCDTREEAKAVLSGHIQQQIKEKQKQVEKLNTECSELAKHAIKIEDEK